MQIFIKLSRYQILVVSTSTFEFGIPDSLYITLRLVYFTTLLTSASIRVILHCFQTCDMIWSSPHHVEDVVEAS